MESCTGGLGGDGEGRSQFVGEAGFLLDLNTLFGPVQLRCLEIYIERIIAMEVDGVGQLAVFFGAGSGSAQERVEGLLKFFPEPADGT